MKKEIKTYLDKEYSLIYSSMNVRWQLGLKNKNEELLHNGLDGSGYAQTMLTAFAIDLIKQTNEKVINLLENAQKDFNFKMSDIEVKDYVSKTISNGKSYVDIYSKDLNEYFEKKGMHISIGSNEITMNNAKGNIEHFLKREEERLILLNKGKNKYKLSKSDWIGIIGIIIGTIIAIIF